MAKKLKSEIGNSRQKIFGIFQILSKIAFIFSIVGASICAVGALCYAAWNNGGQVFSLFGEPILRPVCGCSDFTVCAGILEKEGLVVYYGSCSGTRCDLFPGAVHAHRFTGGEIQLVSASGTGAELHCTFPERSPTEETEKNEWGERIRKSRLVFFGESVGFFCAWKEGSDI